MLTLLALSVFARTPPSAAPEDLLPPTGLVARLKALGLPFAAGHDGSPEGSFTLRGTRVEASLDGEQGQEPPYALLKVRFIGLTIEIPVGRDVPLGEARLDMGNHIPGLPIGVQPHLGRTVTLSLTISLADGFDPKVVRREFIRFWVDGASYARLHGGAFQPAPKRDWTKARFPDACVLDAADDVSLARAAASWGLKPSPVWIEPGIDHFSDYDVDGLPVKIRGAAFMQGATPRTGTLIANLRLPEGVDGVAWAKLHDKAIPGLDPCLHPLNVVAVQERIDMSKGVSLGDLRRRIGAFAARVKAIQATIREAP